MFEELNSALKARRWEEAESLTEKLLTSLPKNPDLLRVQGHILLQLQRHRDALLACEKAVRIRPMFPEAWGLIEQILAFLSDPQPRYSITVITPTIGGRHLEQAIRSVSAQTYPYLRHAIIVDGHSNRKLVDDVLRETAPSRVDLYELPHNVGSHGFNGHRVYGGFPFLVDTEFVAFLDEDNWYEPQHLETLMSRVTSLGLTWAYALRTIVDEAGEFICEDDCESLGKWPTWNAPNIHHVDANCYLLRRDVAITLGPIWNRRARDSVDPDFALCRELLKRFPRCDTNRTSTVNYRVGSTPRSVRPDFFVRGNQIMSDRYGNYFPWRNV